MGRELWSNGALGKYVHADNNDNRHDVIHDSIASLLNGLDPLDWDEVVEPIGLLPEQFFDDPQPSAIPAWLRKMMLAMLMDAIRLLGPPSRRGRRMSPDRKPNKQVEQRRAEAKGEIKKARQWISKDEMDYPFSFTNVCETLGFSPDTMRRYLLCKERDRLQIGRTIKT